MKRISIVLFICFVIFVAPAIGQTPLSRWAKFDSGRVHYYDVGKKNKKALILVHCWTCNAEFWKDSYSAFPEYRVIAIDLPGHGESDKPKINYSMDYFAESIDAVMKDAGVKQAVLAGHSMGTPVVRRFYELHPKSVLGLIIVDGALIPFGTRAEVDKYFAPMFADYEKGAATFIDGMLEAARPDVRPFIRSSMLATPEYVGTSAFRSMLDDSYLAHGKVTVPVLATMAQMPFWPKDLEQQYRQIAPRLEFHMWTGVSHFLMIEKPKQFNDAVRSFISKNQLL